MVLKYVAEEGTKTKEYIFDDTMGPWCFRDIQVPAHVDEWLSGVAAYAESHTNNRTRDFDPDGVDFDAFVFEPHRWVTEIEKEINRIKPPDMKVMKSGIIAEWLLKNEYLQYVSVDGETDAVDSECPSKDDLPSVFPERIPTEAGQKIGIEKVNRTEERDRMGTQYSVEAQKFILDHLNEIVWPDICWY